MAKAKDGLSGVAWGLIGLVVVVVILGGWLASVYNSMVTLNEDVDAQWAQVETVYQRRFDLVPNLASTVKGFFEQERAIFEEITDARAAYSGAATPVDQVAAANSFESALGRLLVIVEDNPEIKSDTTVQSLIAELEGTENRISVERQRYNDRVRDFNVKVKRFPGNFVAMIFGFDEREFFEGAEGSELAPDVDLSI